MNGYNSVEAQNNMCVKSTWMERKLIEVLASHIDKKYGTLKLTLPSGYRCEFGMNEPVADVHLKNFNPIYRLFFGGINGWSESYMAGEWGSDNLVVLVRWALAYEPYLAAFSKASFFTKTLHKLYHWQRDNSRGGSRENISAHYDLGNEFYRHWLDDSMTYSSALYITGEESLEQAQFNKNQRILDLVEAKPGGALLEIGCGWGGFAVQAAKTHQAQVHGVTLSKEQLSWASKKAREESLEDDVSFSLTDYRDVNKKYDSVVSIEMFEAVGEAHWDSYFDTINRVLKPGGRAVLQVISIDDDRFQGYRSRADFIQRYVFPGGMLPSVSVLKSKIIEHGFELKKVQLFGKDYAQTLHLWHKAFDRNWGAIKELGFDDRFYRLWKYYLAYCEGGFDHGAIDVGLYVLAKPEH